MATNQFIFEGNAGVSAKLEKKGEANFVSVFLIQNSSYTDKEGKKVEQTKTVSVECWGLQALEAKDISKGDKVFVTGTLETNNWEQANEETGEVKKYSKLVLRANYVAKLSNSNERRKGAIVALKRVKTGANLETLLDELEAVDYANDLQEMTQK